MGVHEDDLVIAGDDGSFVTSETGYIEASFGISCMCSIASLVFAATHSCVFERDLSEKSGDAKSGERGDESESDGSVERKRSCIALCGGSITRASVAMLALSVVTFASELLLPGAGTAQ